MNELQNGQLRGSTDRFAKFARSEFTACMICGLGIPNVSAGIELYGAGKLVVDVGTPMYFNRMVTENSKTYSVYRHTW